MGRDVLIARSSAIAPEPRVERAARWLAEEGLRVIVVGWDREMKFPEREVRANGVSIVRVRAKGGYGLGLRNLPGIVAFNCALLRAAWRYRPRVFHAVDLDTALPGFLAKRLFGARLFYDIADWYSASRLRSAGWRKCRWLCGIIDVVENWVVKQADCVCLPHEVRVEQLRSRPRRVVVIHNAPEDVRPAASSDGGRGGYVVYAGSLYEDRGIRHLLEAARRAEVKLVVAGFGPLEQECGQAARESRCVIFYGHVDYARALELEAGAIAVAALYDPALEINRVAAPYKWYEAMMLGKPVIVAARTLPARVVSEHGTGLVVEYGDVESLGKAMRYLIEQPREVERMGARARQLYEKHYGCGRQRERLVAAYRELLGGGEREVRGH